MKRIVNIIMLLCVGLIARAQSYVPSSSYGNSYNRGSFKFTFFMPTLSAKPTTLNSTDLHMFALFGDSVTGKLYKYNPKTLLFTDVLDSAFIRADWNEGLRQLTLTRANGSTFATVISGGGSGGGGGATDFTLTRVDSTLTETWNTGPTHSININDIRIKQADINKWNAAVQTGDLAAYLKKTDSTNIYAAKYYVDTGKNAMRILIASKIGIGTTAGGDLSGTYPNPTVAFFAGNPPAYYLNYNNLTNRLTAGNWISLNSNQIAVSPGGTAAEVLRGDGTKSAETDPVYIGDKPNVMLLKVQSLGGSSNLNTYIETGLYHQASDVNAGTGTNYPVARAGMLETQSNGQGTFIYQKYHTYGSFNAIYYRSFNSTWSAWVKVPQAADYNTQDLASVTGFGSTTDKILQATGNASSFINSQPGAEMYYNSGAVFAGYNRGTSMYTTAKLIGGNSATANTLQIAADLTYNGATVLRSDNLGTYNTLQATTNGAGKNTTTSSLQVTGTSNIPTSGAGLELAYNAGMGIFQSYDRTNSKYTTTQLKGGTTSTANVLQIDTSLKFNNLPIYYQIIIGVSGSADFNNLKQSGYYFVNSDAGAGTIGNIPAPWSGVLEVNNMADNNTFIYQTYHTYRASGGAGNRKYYRNYYSGAWSAWKEQTTTDLNTLQAMTTPAGLNTTSNIVQFTGANNTPTSGTGLEVGASGFSAYLSGINRGTGFYYPITIQGGNSTSATPNKFVIDSIPSYNGARVWYSGGTLQSNSNITLGAGGNTNSYPFQTIRNVSSVNYTASMGVGTVGPITGANILTAANATPAQSALLGIAPNGAAPVYSKDNGTTSSYLIHQGNLTATSPIIANVTGTGAVISLSGTADVTTTGTITGGNLSTSGAVTTALIKTSGSKPTVAMSSGATGTATLNSTANTTAGTITVTLTNTVPINANIVQLSFANSLGVLPVVQITAGQSTPFFLGSYSAGGFTISSGGSSAPGTYIFNYFVIQ